ncbi:MAG: hypothetical protein LBS20_11555 [Prevotella sp.]|jgi:hypothetical protein|nr:hypothetical protein [Prevotella sp.]
MKDLSPNKIKQRLEISYLGSCSTSPKLIKSLSRNVMTYGLYLAPYNISGYNVCPESCNCSKYCLYGSGRSKIEFLARKEAGTIQSSRIKKTRLFFEDRPAFMSLLVHEISQAIKKAEIAGMKPAVRLNCASDLSPEEFILGGKNILQIFPNLQFYDYSKIPGHMQLAKKYANYDLTFSYSGENWDDCEAFLKQGYRIAVVFDGGLPATFKGYPVINANDDDIRFLDNGGIICGLTYKKVANDYVDGKYRRPDTTFITRKQEGLCA